MSSDVETGRITTDIPARLDRLPWARWHWLVVIGLGTVWGLIFIYLGGALKKVFGNVGITVPDLDEAHAFFTGVLGCEYMYTLGPFQHDDTWIVNQRLGQPDPLELAGGTTYAVKVPTTASNRTYWLEYRQPIGFDSPNPMRPLMPRTIANSASSCS